MQRNKGFTLLELMVTLAIVGIIAAVAYPSFIKSAYKGRRADAKGALTTVSQMLERCYANYGVYNSGNCGPNSAGNSQYLGGFTSQKGYYTITGTTTGTSYIVVATAVSGGPQANDTSCTILTLNSAGQQGSGSATATSDAGGCW